MLDKVKRALVESYIGAIGLGFLLVRIISNFVNIFVSPVLGWVARKQFLRVAAGMTPPSRSPLEYAAPELLRFLLLLVIWYVLLYWLYLKPLKGEPSEPAPSPGQLAD
jgi:hypothetical protein